MKKPLPDCLLDQLPEHEIIEEISQAFSDSTHRLWRLQHSGSDHTNQILKVCSKTQSPFWQIMHDLFDYDLKAEIPNFSKTYDVIEQACSLEIPQLITADKCNETSFILAKEIDGNACDADISNQMVIRLAEHLAELHSLKNKQWGSIRDPKFVPDDWSKRLKTSLRESTRKWGGVFLQSKFYLKQAIQACDAIEVTECVAMIPDLRWDQFLQKDNKLSALVDLDAFVYAPRELDFVILEYLLSADLVNVFAETYSKYHVIPDIESVRPAYRLLLFYMQILGETDLDRWMNHDKLFS